jgi:ASC-1-like (ASCH) protein
MMEVEQARLFVPLNARAYEWFASGAKRYELRRYRRQYNLIQIKEGRTVELRRGYSGESLWGEVGEIHTGEDLSQLLHQVDYRSVLPSADSLGEALEIAQEFVGSEGPYILFEVRKQEI